MPIPLGNLSNIWSKLELRAMIMGSLLLQIILIAFGSRRKYTKMKWIVVLVWLSYLFADTVSTFSIGLLLRHGNGGYGEGRRGGGSLKDSSSRMTTMLLPMFWSPFLLLHLGGPDTITAYSKKDNELWLRHLLNLVVQVVAVFYGLLNYWNSKNALSILTIPIFISGLMKYGERTWVLSSASTDPFVRPLEVHHLSLSENVTYAEGLCSAYGFVVETFKGLVCGAIFIMPATNAIDENLPPDEAFKIVELELSLMFDLIYTKTRAIYSIPGFTFRFFTFLSILSTLAIFCISIDKHNYSSIDVAITMSLLAGAVGLEVYAAFINIFSDWTLLWLASRFNRPLLCKPIYQAIWSSHSRLYSLSNKTRRSMSIGQLKLKSYWSTNSKLLMSIGYNTPFRMGFNLRTSWLVSHAEVGDLVLECLRERLFKRAVDERKRDVQTRREQILPQRLLDTCRGYDIPPELTPDSGEQFDLTVIGWHVATDVMYDDSELKEEGSAACEASKLLADYMFYLLAACPILLPKSIARATWLEIFVRPGGEPSPNEQQRIVQGFRTSVREGKTTKGQMWNDVVCEVWVSLLIYAAAKCRWEEQVEQLGKGGEFLTHVWLLMVHLNLAEEFH